MTHRIRTLAAIAACRAVAAPAAAVPSMPLLDAAPAHAQGTTATPTWSRSTFGLMSTDRGYEIEAVDTGGGVSWRALPGDGITSHTLTGLDDGEQYTVRVRSRERECLVPAFRTCPAWSATYTQSPWSPPVLFRMDATAPTGTVSIDGGAQFTTDLDVDLTHIATDPVVAGPAAGLGWLEVSQDGKFTCEAEARTSARSPSRRSQRCAWPTATTGNEPSTCVTGTPPCRTRRPMERPPATASW